jgi:hypothetical protein
MPWIGGYAGAQDIFMYVTTSLLSKEPGRGEGLTNSTDNDSYHYACAGKHVVRLEVHAWDKNVSLHPGLWQPA